MFGSIGITEIMVIAGVALIFLGPEKFPEFAKIAARTVRDLRRYVDEAKRDLSEELKPVKKELDELSKYDPAEYIEKLADSAMGDDVRSDDGDGGGTDSAGDGGDDGAGDGAGDGGDDDGGDGAGGYVGEDFDYNLEPHLGGGAHPGGGHEFKTDDAGDESGADEGGGGVSPQSDSDGDASEGSDGPESDSGGDASEGSDGPESDSGGDASEGRDAPEGTDPSEDFRGFGV